MTNTIVNHFNDVLSKSQFDINTCVEIDKEYIIFDLNNLITDSNKNFIELREILSKYKIIFNTNDLNIQFTPFFKLVQEILIFNYEHFINSAKNRSNRKCYDHLRILFILNQFFKQPFTSESSLNQLVVNANANIINNTTKLSKLLDLNYDLLPENFATYSSNDSNIKKIRGGKVKYQGTWVSCNFGIKLLKLIGGFDVLSQLLGSIFKFLAIDYKTNLNQNNNSLSKINCSISTKSVIWTHFPANFVKLREYRSDSRIGKKRGKYNKTKKHVPKKLNKSMPVAVVAPPPIEPVKPLVVKKRPIKLSPILQESVKFKKKISLRGLSNQDFLNKIAFNHIEKCNIFASGAYKHPKNLSAGSDKVSTFKITSRHVVSPSLLSACNLHYDKDIINNGISKENTYVESNSYISKSVKDYGVQSEISDYSVTPLPYKVSGKQLLAPFELPANSSTSVSSPKRTQRSDSFSSSIISSETTRDAFESYKNTPKSFYTEIVDMSSKTLVSKSPEKSNNVSAQSLSMLDKINEPLEFDCFDYQEANIQAYSNFGYKMTTRSEHNNPYVSLGYETRSIKQTCQNESFSASVQDTPHQQELVDSVVNYVSNDTSRAREY